jgi:transposase
MAVAAGVQEELAAEFAALFPHLDERQRRLAMGARARSLGHGGITAVARAAGVNAVTVSRGVAELESGGEPLRRARRPGAGRKDITETDPRLVPALLALVDPAARGDPESPLRWTVKSTRTLAGELTRQGHRVSDRTVARLLAAEGFSLQGNAKQVEGSQHPDRDAQFRYISGQASSHGRAAGDQRGRQEEGERRQVQERRAGMAAQRRARAGERLRLHR